jgi:O-antigen/teichoic acid export membrane protein
LIEPEEINTKINFGSGAFKKYFANTSWIFAEKFIRILLAFIVGIYVVRYLGPESFGVLSYVISFVGLFATIATLGLDSIVVRELVKDSSRRDELLGSVFYLRVIGALIAIVLTIIAAFILKESYSNIILICIIVTSTLFQSLNVVEYYFQANVVSKFNVYVQSSSLIVASLIKVFLVLFSAPLISFAIVYVVEYIFLSFGFYLVYKINNLKIKKWKFKSSTAIVLLKDAWPLVLSGVVISIYMKIDQVMIKNMLSSKEVGYYAAAVKLSEAWYFIPMAICTSLFPAIVKAKQVSEKLYLSRLQKLYDILAWMSIGIAIPVTFLSEFIIKILFGVKFLPAAPVLTIYIWAGVATFLGVASSQYLISENMTKLSFFRTLIGMIINVILNLIFIPIYGIVGSALATLISYTLATFSIVFFEDTRTQFIMMLKSITFFNFIPSIMNIWLSHLVKK